MPDCCLTGDPVIYWAKQMTTASMHTEPSRRARWVSAGLPINIEPVSGVLSRYIPQQRTDAALLSWAQIVTAKTISSEATSTSKAAKPARCQYAGRRTLPHPLQPPTFQAA